MSMTRKVIILACVLALVGLGAWASGTTEKKALPRGTRVRQRNDGQ